MSRLSVNVCGGGSHEPGGPCPDGYMDRQEWHRVQQKAGYRQEYRACCERHLYPFEPHVDHCSLKRKDALPLSAMALLLCAVGMAGCASPARTILTSANGYHYWHARYSERCPSPTEALCKETSVLTRWHTALGEANDALQRGGKLPLQLEALAKVEKGTKKWQR